MRTASDRSGSAVLAAAAAPGTAGQVSARGELLLLKIEASVLVALEYPAARALVATFSNETTGDDGNGEEQTTDCNKLGLGGTGE